MSFPPPARVSHDFGSTMQFSPSKVSVFEAQSSRFLGPRDAPVMHAQIETPAFAGVSLAGL
jgi:hypothetical protein